MTDRLAELRRLRAELALVDEYDRRRSIAGYDYGAGQRARELSRYRSTVNELERNLYAAPASLGAGDLPTELELREAFERVLAPKVRRLERESYRQGSKSSDRTLRLLVAMRDKYASKVPA